MKYYVIQHGTGEYLTDGSVADEFSELLENAETFPSREEAEEVRGDFWDPNQFEVVEVEKNVGMKITITDKDGTVFAIHEIPQDSLGDLARDIGNAKYCTFSRSYQEFLRDLEAACVKFKSERRSAE